MPSLTLGKGRAERRGGGADIMDRVLAHLRAELRAKLAKLDDDVAHTLSDDDLDALVREIAEEEKR